VRRTGSGIDAWTNPAGGRSLAVRVKTSGRCPGFDGALLAAFDSPGVDARGAMPAVRAGSSVSDSPDFVRTTVASLLGGGGGAPFGGLVRGFGGLTCSGFVGGATFPDFAAGADFAGADFAGTGADFAAGPFVEGLFPAGPFVGIGGDFLEAAPLAGFGDAAPRAGATFEGRLLAAAFGAGFPFAGDFGVGAFFGLDFALPLLEVRFAAMDCLTGPPTTRGSRGLAGA
jgi:hypothetical protein